MLILKQSTAITLKMGPFLDNTDGDTVEGALAIAQADVRLSKNGGNFAQKNHVGAGVYDEGGWYDIPLDATDTNTLGRLVIYIHEAGALQVWERAMVMPAQEFESLFGTDVLQVDLTQWLGVAPLALNAQRVQTHLGATDAAAIVAASFAANALSAAAMSQGAADKVWASVARTLTSFGTLVNDVADQVWDELRAGHVGAGSFGQGVASVQGNVTGSVASVVGNVGGNVVGSVASVVGNLGGNVVGNVQGTVASVVGNLGGDVVGNVQGNVLGTVASVVGAVGSVTGNVGGNVTGSVGSVVGNVGGNVVGTVASVVGNVGGNVVGSVASVVGNVGGNVAGSVASMLAAGRNQMADSYLVRNLNNVDAIAPFRSVAGAAGKQVNRVAQALGILTIYQTDDVTPWGTQTITEDATANPIVGLDTV